MDKLVLMFPGRLTGLQYHQSYNTTIGDKKKPHNK